MDDFGTEIEEVKREIVESRSLTIKTNNLVNALSADVNSISKRQQANDRKMVLNSAVAYVAAVVIMMVGAKVLVDARVEAEHLRTKDRRDKLEDIQKELDSIAAREEAHARSERKAEAYFKLIVQKKRRDVIEQYEAISKLDLRKTERLVFQRAYEQARNYLSLMSYHAGLDHIRTGRWHEAEESLADSLKMKSDASHGPEARYQRSRALQKLGRQREAIEILVRLTEASADKEVMDDATLLLANAQIDIKAWNDAKGTLRSFIRRFPKSTSILEARSKLGELQLYH